MNPVQPKFLGRYVNDAIVVLEPPWSGESNIKQPSRSPDPARDQRVEPGPLIDGAPGDFRARLVVVGCGSSLPELDAPVASALAAGSATFRFLGLLRGGAAVCRYFQVAPGQSVRLDVTPYSTIRVDLVVSTARNAACYAFPVSGRADADRQALCAVEHTATGTYLTPPGAAQLIAGTADAFFNWRVPLDATRLVSVPQTLVAGSAYSVAGLYYTVGTVPFRAVFRVDL